MTGSKVRRLLGCFVIVCAGSSVAGSVAFAVAPQLDLPDVPLPRSPQAPGVPSVPLPAPGPHPEVPSPQLPVEPALPSLPSSGAGGGGPSAGYQAPAGAGSVGSVGSLGASGTDAVAGVGGATSTRTSADRPTRAQRQAERPRAAARERRFRRVVRRHAPCFYALSRFERRVLALRAGTGGARPYSRASTARRLHVSQRTLRRTERRALTQLRRTDRSEGCALDLERGIGRLDAAVTTLGEALALAPSAAAARVDVALRGAQSGGDRTGVLGVRESGGERPGSVTPAAIPVPDAPDADGGPGLLIASLLAGALLLAGLIAAARGRRPAEATEAGDRWSTAEGTVPPAPWSVPAEGSEKQPGPYDDRRAVKPPGSAPPRRSHSGRPDPSQPRKRG